MRPYKRLLGLLSRPALDVGTVQTVLKDGAVVQIPTGGTVRIRGETTEGRGSLSRMAKSWDQRLI